MLDPAPFLPFLAAALAEDRGGGDPTSEAIVPEGARSVADLVAREPGVVCGVSLVEPLVRALDSEARVDVALGDGSRVAEGSVVATVRGRSRAVLGAERTALNFVRHLSGVATTTARFVDAVAGLPVRVLDTRKTTPGWRDLEKYAVRCGGGENHRRGLSDAAMVKENHLIAAFGRTGPASVAEAVRRLRAAGPAGLPLLVEVETFDELRAAVDEGVDVAMLDGWSLEDLRRAVAFVRGRGGRRPLLEATGGVTLENVRAIASTGVDRVSIGALTHSAPALDLSLRHRPAS